VPWPNETQVDHSRRKRATARRRPFVASFVIRAQAPAIAEDVVLKVEVSC